MKQIFASSHWTRVILVLGSIFMVWSIALIVSVKRQQAELADDVVVIDKLNGITQSILALEKSLEMTGPDGNTRWPALYGDYRTRRGEFDPSDPDFRELQVNLIRTDSLLIRIGRLHTDWKRAVGDEVTQKSLEADFYREINVATMEVQNAMQTARQHSGRISLAMAGRATGLFILVLLAGALAIAVASLLRWLHQELAKTQEADAALRASEEHFRQTFEHTPIGMAVSTLEGKLIQANPAFCKFLGYTEAELLRRQPAEIFHSEDLAAQRHLLSQLPRGETATFQLEKRFLHKKQQTIHTLVQASLMRDADGGAPRLIEQVLDLAAQRQAEFSLRQSEERFRELAENIDDVFWITDPAKNEVFYVNTAYEKIWQRSAQGLYETPQEWMEAIHPEDRERVRKAALTKQVIGQYDETYRIQLPDGETRWVHDRAFPIRDEQGSVYRIAGLTEDITERKELEAALQEREQRGNFAIESSDAGVWDWDVQTNKVVYSRQWKEMLGYQEYEISDSLDECYSRIHSEDLPAMIAALEKHLRGETPVYASEHRKRCKDGSYKRVKDRAKVMSWTAEGKPLRVFGLHTLIAEPAPAKMELHLADSGLSPFIENLPAGILCEDQARRVVYMNQKFCDLFGIPAAPTACVGMDGHLLAEQIQKQFLEPERFVPRLEEIFASCQLTTNEVMRLQDGRIFERDAIPILVKNECVGRLWYYRDVTTDRRAEETLRNNEEQFRLTFETAPVGITISGVDGALRQCNQAFADMLGYTIEELQGKTWLELTHPDDMSTTIAFHERLLRGDLADFQMQKRYLAKDGQAVHAKMQMTLIKDHQGRPQYFISQSLNLAAHAGAQSELPKQDAILQAIVDGMADGVVVVDAAGKFLILNPAAASILGVEMTETAPQDWAEKCGLYLPDQVTPFPLESNPLMRVMQGDAAPAVELFVRNAQRPRGVWLSMTGTPRHDEDGKATGGVVVFRDITEHKQAEEILRKNEEQFRLTFEYAPIGMAISSIDGAILQVNQAYCDILGRPADELIGRSVMEFTHPEDAAENMDLTRKLLRGEIPQYQMEKRYLAKVGHTIYAILQASLVRDRDGHPLHFIGQIADITKRKLAEEEIRQLNADLEQRVVTRTKELRESEERFRALYDDNPSIYFTVDVEGIVLSVNQFGAEELGYATTELTGAPVTKIFSEVDQAKARQYINTCLNNPGRSFTWELCMVRKNESTLWVREYARAAQDHAGQPVVFVVCEDITSRRRAELMLQASETRLRKQNESLGELVRSKTFQSGNLQEALQAVTEVAARCMEVERVGVWFYDEAHTKIVCRDLFELAPSRHSAGTELFHSDLLPFFAALSEGRDIAAHDAQNDYRTRCFRDSYLRPLGITSLLDAPIRLRGDLVGVLCHEHIGSQRQWSLDEQVFAAALADLVAQALEAHERARAEQARQASEERLRRQNESLHTLVSNAIFQNGKIQEVYREITATVARSMNVARVGIWLYDEARTKLVCENLYELNADQHSHGVELSRQDSLLYFEALAEGRYIDAHDAQTDYRTRCFVESYFKPLGITSMLDAPIRLGGRIIGVVCHEHIGPARQWTLDEKVYAGSVADLTALAIESRRLEKSEARYRTLIETMNDGLVQLDEKGLLTYVNDKMCEMTGFPREQLLGREVLPRLDTENREILHEQIERRQTGESKPYEMEIRRNGAGKFPVLISPRPIFDDEGRFSGSFAVVTDISARKRMEEQIRQHAEELERLVDERAQRIRLLEQQRAESEKLAATGRMSARIAHEINNPLAGIKNSFLLVKDGIPTTHRYYDYVRRIETEIERIARIVRQMFDLYRPQQESMRSFPADMAIRDVVALLSTNCRERDITIAVEMNTPALNVALSEGSLRQVLYNVIQNAIDASAPGSTVRVRAFAAERQLIIHVIDQGQGIPEAIRAKIFEPFFTTKSGLERSGLGLGLSVSKGLVEALGGRIDFESAVGHGTTFIIALPLEVANDKMISASAVPATAQNSEPN